MLTVKKTQDLSYEAEKKHIMKTVKELLDNVELLEYQIEKAEETLKRDIQRLADMTKKKNVAYRNYMIAKESTGN